MSKVFNMVGGGGGVTASIFVTGLSETDTVTATNGSKTLTGKWMQKPNPAAHGLPDGYTELEYIESSGTQHINTGVSPTSDLKCSIRLTPNVSYMSDHAIFGAAWSASGYFLMFHNSGIRWHSKGASIDISSFYKDSINEIETSMTNIVVNGTQYSISGTGTDSTNPIHLFSTDERTSDFSTGWLGRFKLHSFKMFKGEDKIREFIPAKRNSDSVIGLYDLVSDTFFENSGTGTFTAGPEIPQTIDGFLIKPIRDLGTWTVTATDGTETYTQDVLVDVITEYEIEITKKLYLYRDGDECEDVTGGWEKKPYADGVGTLKKYDKYMEVNAPYSTTHLIGFVNGALSMSELRKYKTLNALYDFTTPSNTDGGACFWIGTTTTYDYSSGGIGSKVDHQKLDSYGDNASVQDVVITTDVSNMNYGYIVVACYYGNMRIKKVWLE